MGTRAFKDELYSRFAQVAAALGSPRRFELAELLAQGERSVEELALEADLTVANVSQHLQKLLAANLVATRKQGTRVFYRLAAREVTGLLRVLREAAERHDASLARVVQLHLGRQSGGDVVPDEVAGRLSDPSFVVLDVRPIREYDAGHIAGAQALPVDELAKRRRLPFAKTCEIVAYCRGPYCTFADEAVEILRKRGYRARRMRIGFPEWEELGLATARSV
jgi:rhodanese-related sulfurtransferase/DNA-binding transcriptional ArsR family regulator